MCPTDPEQQRHWELGADLPTVLEHIRDELLRIQPSGIVSSPALLFGHSMGFSLGFLLPGTGLLQERGQKSNGVINQRLF